MTEAVREKLALLSSSPGVYLMKNAQGKIIYVGKAVVLKNRVRQYFQSNRNQSPKVRAMVAKVADFETILTGSEVEALILECNLIKKYRPRYNISLKDDKTYPYVKVTLGEKFPRVLITRRILKDGARYFGPYTQVGAVHESLRLLRRLFPLRTCKHMDIDRPCLEYHIKRCLAPCTGEVDPGEYAKMVAAVCLFLEGRTEEVERILTARMTAAAEALQFELAARLRRSWNVDYDDAGAIGRRYRRQDEVGTPFCLTYDFDSPDDGAVTVRDRDTMAQDRIPLDGVERYLAERLIGC